MEGSELGPGLFSCEVDEVLAQEESGVRFRVMIKAQN